MEKNFYEILELPLDPPLKDVAKVQAAIDAKAKEWNKMITTLGNKGVIFKSYKDKVPLMKEQLGNAATLSAQADEAVNKALKSVSSAISLVSGGKGQITESQLSVICAKHPGLKRSTIEAKASGMGVRLVKDAAPSPSATLPQKPEPPTGIKMPRPVQLKDLTVNLPVLGAGSIYEVLGCTPTTSIQTLKGIIDKYKIRTKKMPKGTAVADAHNTISTIAPAVFADEASKKGFDYAWANELATSKVVPKIDLLVSGSPPTISRESYLKLINELRELGMRKEDAEWYVYDECCNRRKAAFPAPAATEAAVKSMVQCPNCYALNEQGARRCGKCRNWLKIICPSCGKDVDATRQVCTCGFALCDVPLAIRAIEHAKATRAKSDLIAAEEHARIALHYWPKNQEAESILKELSSMRAEQEKAKFREILAQLKAPAYGSVKRTPGGTISITWDGAQYQSKILPLGGSIPLPTGGTASPIYKLVRKENGAPATLADGKVIMSGSSHTYEDAEAQPGVIYGYSVFVGLGEQMVSGGCTCGKGQLIPSPQGLSISAGDEKLTLSWKHVPSAQGCVIIRKKGAIPRDEKDGVLIRAACNSGAYTDSGLDNEQMYGYRLALLFKDVDGKEVLSDFVSSSGTPLCPPPALPPTNWQVKATGKELEITWKGMPAHEVRWYVSSTAIAQAGSLLDANSPQLNAAQSINQVSQVDRRAVYSTPFTGVKWITPAVMQGKHALICEAKQVTSHPGVSNLQVQRSQGHIYLTCNWPENCEEILVAYSAHAYPATPEDKSAAGKQMCTQVQYNHKKAVEFPNVGDSPFYFTVFAKIKDANGSYYSTGQNVLSISASQKQSITYCLQSKKAMVFFGKTTWHLRISTSGKSIPALQLRGKRGSQPVNKNDGMALLTTEPTKESSLDIVIQDHQLQPGYCCKLFLADADDAQLYSINHLAPSQLTIK